MAEKWESDSVEKHLRKTKQNGIQLSFLIFVLFFKNEISLHILLSQLQFTGTNSSCFGFLAMLAETVSAMLDKIESMVIRTCTVLDVMNSGYKLYIYSTVKS